MGRDALPPPTPPRLMRARFLDPLQFLYFYHIRTQLNSKNNYWRLQMSTLCQEN